MDKPFAQMVEAAEPQPFPDEDGLSGRVAIVTGGSSGIGRAIALELGRHGVDIAFNYLGDDDESEADAARTRAELRQLEIRAYSRAGDVRDAEDCAHFVRETQERLGSLHILVNNAGIGRDRALWHMTEEQWKAVIDTNLTGAFHMIRAVAPILRRQQYGKIVNISSVHGIRSEFGLSNYASSKAGVLGLTRSAAVELGPSNINVNALAPGYIRTTRLTEGVPPEVIDRARERSVLGRLGDPRDVAAVVAFLCSERARHVTGAVIPVDGGHLL